MDDDDELHLGLYQTLQEKADMQMQSIYSHMKTGIVSIAATVGYAFYAGIPQFIALVPIIFAAVLHEISISARRLGYISDHLGRIEDKLSETAEHFDWEQSRGIIGEQGPTTIEIGPSSRQELPFPDVGLITPVTIAGGAYIGFMAIGLEMWTTCMTEGRLHSCPDPTVILGVTITPGMIGAVYLGLFCLLVIESSKGFVIVWNLRKDH